MRILVCTNMFPSAARPWSGCFVAEQVDDLRALGCEIDVLDFDGSVAATEYLRVVPRLRHRLHASSYDLVHAHYGLSGAVALAQRRAPIVTTFHGSDTGYVPWQARLSWVVARLTSPIFVNSDGARRLGLPKAPVIPMGVDLDRFVPLNRQDARRGLGWPNRPTVLFPGARAQQVKGADLFDATLEDARGRVPDLRAVSLEGYTRDQVALVMNAVDVMLMTSRSEGSPMTVKEALACVTPVVSVDVGDVAQTIAGLVGCAVAPRDPRALGSALVFALAAPRDEALRRRANVFARPEIAARVLAVYRQTIDASRTRATASA